MPHICTQSCLVKATTDLFSHIFNNGIKKNEQTIKQMWEQAVLCWETIKIDGFKF